MLKIYETDQKYLDNSHCVSEGTGHPNELLNIFRAGSICVVVIVPGNKGILQMVQMCLKLSLCHIMETGFVVICHGFYEKAASTPNVERFKKKSIFLCYKRSSNWQY